MKNKLLLILLIVLPALLFSQRLSEFPKPKIDYNPLKYICYRTFEEMNIDGKLDEHQWHDAEWTSCFADIEGSLKPAPKYKTRVKMLWDDQFLYIAAELEEEHIWATLTGRDQVIFNNNDFEVFIDPDGDTHKYCELEINALNTIWDLLLVKPYRDGDNVALTNWDIKGLRTAVNIEGTLNNAEDKDKKWTIEIAVPWAALSEITSAELPPSENAQWKINFSRVEWETEIDNGLYTKAKDPKTNNFFPEHNWVWSPQGIVAMHYPEMWGLVQFSYKVVGFGKDTIVENSEDKIKWFLRQIYYKERDYYLNNNCYTENLKELNLPEFYYGKEKFIPFIKSALITYHASINHGENVYTIFQDGLIQTLKLKKP